MNLFWKDKKNGFDLVIVDDGNTTIVGGVRITKKGIEAMAKARGYDPGRSVKDLTSVEEGKKFVEDFKPWIEFCGMDLEIESETSE